MSYLDTGNESKIANAIGNYDVVGQRGGCEINECFNGFRTKYGEGAHGFC